jgi:glyoxylase-like metal-dependent hydrolase (beta-lactamase superfamily II)
MIADHSSPFPDAAPHVRSFVAIVPGVYSGDVSVGGAADVRELPEVTISKLAVGDMDNNAYLLRCSRTGAQVLIDAAAEPDRLLELAGPDGLDAVITTHRHADHWGALSEVIAATGAPVYAHEADADAIDVPIEHRVREGEVIAFGDVALGTIHLTGHTPGSLVLVYDDPTGHHHIFTGDCLFPGGVGRTWSAADFDALYEGVVTKVFDHYDDETWIYPGHGNDTVLGDERPCLADWRERGW